MASEDTDSEELHWLAKDYSSAAWGFWLTPTILLFPLLLPLLEPSSIPQALTEFWDLYLLFFGLPWAIGTAFWVHSRRLKRRS